VQLRLQSVMMAVVSWRKSRIEKGLSLKSSVFSREWNVAKESARGGGEGGGGVKLRGGLGG